MAPVSVITTTWRMVEPVTKGATRGPVLLCLTE
jgi:hypothetical protein